MRTTRLSTGILLASFAVSSMAQDSLCNPCVDPPMNRQFVPEPAPIRTRAEVARERIPFVTPDDLRRMAPEDAVRRLLRVLEAQGETEMAAQLRNTPPEDAIRGLLASWGIEPEVEATPNANSDAETDGIEPQNE